MRRAASLRSGAIVVAPRLRHRGRSKSALLAEVGPHRGQAVARPKVAVLADGQRTGVDRTKCPPPGRFATATARCCWRPHSGRGDSRSTWASAATSEATAGDSWCGVSKPTCWCFLAAFRPACSTWCPRCWPTLAWSRCFTRSVSSRASRCGSACSNAQPSAETQTLVFGLPGQSGEQPGVLRAVRAAGDRPVSPDAATRALRRCRRGLAVEYVPSRRSADVPSGSAGRAASQRPSSSRFAGVARPIWRLCAMPWPIFRPAIARIRLARSWKRWCFERPNCLAPRWNHAAFGRTRHPHPGPLPEGEGDGCFNSPSGLITPYPFPANVSDSGHNDSHAQRRGCIPGDKYHGLRAVQKRLRDRDGFVIVRNFLGNGRVQRSERQPGPLHREVVPRLPDAAAFYQDRSRPETLKQMQHMGALRSLFRKLSPATAAGWSWPVLLGEEVEAQSRNGSTSRRTPSHRRRRTRTTITSTSGRRRGDDLAGARSRGRGERLPAIRGRLPPPRRAHAPSGARSLAFRRASPTTATRTTAPAR